MVIAPGRQHDDGVSEAGPRQVRGFRPGARRRSRLAIGAALMALAVGGNVAVYASLDQRAEVLQVSRDVPAGVVLSAGDLRVVKVGGDPTVRVLRADQLDQVVGHHAKVRLVSGSLLVAEALQSGPLVTPGAAVVAVQVADGGIPSGLRERSRVQLVVPGGRGGTDPGAMVVDGLVVGLPSSTQSVTGRVSVSVEVERSLAATVAAGDDVRIVLLDPAGGP